MVGLISTEAAGVVMVRENGGAVVRLMPNSRPSEQYNHPRTIFRRQQDSFTCVANTTLNNNNNTKDPLQDEKPPPLHAADEDDQVLALNNYAEGFLVKQGARVKNWKRRYFVFRDGYMSYRKDQRENSRVLGTDVVIDWSGVEFGLALKLSSGRSLYVSPTSEQQACIWYEVVQGYIMRQQMIRQLQHVDRQRQKHLEPIWETDNAAEQSAELIQYNLLR